ncbi:MAG: tRNA-dihydrouridine synthase family protein [Elusimicrobiota bacterium]|jgi:nifR3 family TIM-barrel protein
MPDGLKLGGLGLPVPVLQSPMAACTDLPFRLVARRRGLAFAFTEMVSAQSLVRKNPKTLDILRTRPGDRPLGAQLLGRDPAQLAAAAAMIQDMGFDLLDLNFGCPVKKVVSNGEGAALLDEPALAEKIFVAVRKAVKLPLTVKTRKGSRDESGQQAVELALRAEAQGLDAITVHGRTQRQQYGGRSDPGAVAMVCQAVSIPVIGNGDVCCGADAVRLRQQSGCQGVMIGRAGLGNPWLYQDVARSLSGNGGMPQAPSAAERRDALLEHFDLEVEIMGQRMAALNMRRFGAWYTAGIPSAKHFRVAMCQTMDTGALRSLIEEFFSGLRWEPSAPQAPDIREG